MRRPATDELAPFYRGYLATLPDCAVLELLERQGDATAAGLGAVPAGRERWAYAPGKWSIRQVAGHLIDAERLFAFRALAFARRDPAELPGMDQDAWMAAAPHAEVPLPRLVAEFRALRTATVALFAALTEAMAETQGTANGCRFTAGSMAWLIAGHERHHLGVLRERYGVQVALPG